MEFSVEVLMAIKAWHGKFHKYCLRFGVQQTMTPKIFMKPSFMHTPPLYVLKIFGRKRAKPGFANYHQRGLAKRIKIC